MRCEQKYLDRATIPIKSGWYRFHETSEDTYACPYVDSCGGFSNSTNANETSAGKVLCKTGYHGPLCSVCDTGYGFSQGTYTCEKCEASLYGSTVGVFAGIVMVVLGCTVLLRWLFANRIKKAIEMMKERKKTVNLVLSQLTTVAVTIQTGILINENHQAAGGKKPPEVYSNFLKAFRVFSLKVEVLPLECFLDVDFSAILLFQTLGTLLIIVGCAIAWHKPCQKQNGAGIERPTRRIVFATCGITFIKLILPAVSLVIAQAFRCNVFDYGMEESHQYLESDYSINCASEKYSFIWVYAVIMTLVFPIGMPLLALLGLYRSQRRINERKEGPLAVRERNTGYVPVALDALDAPDVDEGENVIEGVIANESPFASLATNVKPGWWFMEVIDMERRLLLTCFPLVFTTYGGVVLFTLCIALLALVVQYESRPYALMLMNTSKAIEAWQNLLAVFVLLIQDADMFQSNTLYTAAGVGLVLVDVFMVGIMMSSAFKKRWNRNIMQSAEKVDKGSLKHDEGGAYLPPLIDSNHAGGAEEEAMSI